MSNDPQFQRCLAIIRTEGKCSTSLLQRHLHLGYMAASHLMLRLERAHVVAPIDAESGTAARTIYPESEWQIDRPPLDLSEVPNMHCRPDSEVNGVVSTMPSGFDYLVSYGGGVGPDVWDAEMEVNAADLADALAQARRRVEESGGWILRIDQKDYPEPTRDKLQAQLETLRPLENLVARCLALMKDYRSGGQDPEDLVELVKDYFAAEAQIPEGEYEGADGLEDVVRWLFAERAEHAKPSEEKPAWPLGLGAFFQRFFRS